MSVKSVILACVATAAVAGAVVSVALQSGEGDVELTPIAASSPTAGPAPAPGGAPLPPGQQGTGAPAGMPVPDEGMLPPEGEIGGANPPAPPGAVYAGFADPAYDRDDDGRLDPQEYVDGNVKQLREDINWQFDQLDTDGDGTVTRAEYVDSQIGSFDDFMRDEFDARDTDGDGLIDPVAQDAAPTPGSFVPEGAIPPPPPGDALPDLDGMPTR